MDITLPDGTILRDVPEGTTKAQIAAKLKASGYDMSRLESQSEEPSIFSQAAQTGGNLLAGGIRGAGSIGATLLYPIDKITDIVKGDRDPNLTSLITGQKPLSRNEERRKQMDDALSSMGAETDSFAYGAGKLAGEIAGTAGAGGAIANVATRVPGVALATPRLLQAIRTSGVSAGAGGTAMQNAFMRAVGGGVSGGAQAALVNPEEAATGAVIGAALPGTLGAIGKTGNLMTKLVRGTPQTPEMAAAVSAARDAGYVIPPSQASPTLVNRLAEGFAGKLSTAQNASAKNQDVTKKLAAQALGLPTEVKITPESLQQVRQVAGQAYDAIGKSGLVQPNQSYFSALDNIAAPYLQAAKGFPNAKPSPVIDLVDSLKSPSFDASSAVAKIKELRTMADDAFRKGDTDIARASKASAKALEDAVEGHLSATGATGLLQDFKDARQLIAKTYSVEKALNATTGTIDAKKLAAQLAKGKPLSEELRTAAEFAQRFPKAAQTLESMGSLPQASPLDWFGAIGLSAASSNPLMMAAAAARPATRAAILSAPVQNRLVQSQAGLMQSLYATPKLNQLAHRSAPVVLSPLNDE